MSTQYAAFFLSLFLMGLTFLRAETAETAETAERVLFEDDFNNGLSADWQLKGLDEEDYRMRIGGLELRVQAGERTHMTPRLHIDVPFASDQRVVATVEVSILDRFTEPNESAGVFLTVRNSIEFGAEKKRINGYLLFSPGESIFIGEPGEEGDPAQYAVKFWPANESAGPLRIIVRNNYASFQVGPSKNGKYFTFFRSAIDSTAVGRGFSLMASGGPESGNHWVRFDNFRVTK